MTRQIGRVPRRLTDGHDRLRVSQALFPDVNIRVSGLHWCKPKKAGLAALTGKTLCQKHPSELSGLDDNVKRAFVALDAATRLHETRSKIIIRQWTIKTFAIDGQLLESGSSRRYRGGFASCRDSK